MNVEDARELCLRIKGAEECQPFDENSLVYKIMGKMFALIFLENHTGICLKCDPERAIELRERYRAIQGAYHFNKKYWNSIDCGSDVDKELLETLIAHSVDEVLKKMTKKDRLAYEAL